MRTYDPLFSCQEGMLVQKHRCLKKITAITLLITLILNIFSVSLTVFADNRNRKVVRVGWHESPYFITDEYGRESGYSYEYQCKVAAYTGWEYEYIKGTWPDLLQMLKDGEIDLLSDISYSEERAKEMLYPSIPMGTEVYYLFVAPDNQEITPDDFSTLNGKRIGVTKNSIQKEYFIDWADKHEINVDLIELNITGDESLQLLGSDLDAVVTMDVYGSPNIAMPICKIGASDFYFAVNKNRPDLLNELDMALNRIQDENKYYDQQLYNKYLKNTETNSYLNSPEKMWLADHGAIRVGYQDNYLAFCAKDKYTGELTGALKDYLEYASSAFQNVKLEFETISYPTAAAAIEALKDGEIDCMFPVNLTDYDAEKLGLLITPPLMHTEMDAVVRASEKKEFLKKDHIVVAVNEGNTNYDIFLADNYPDWEKAYFKDTPTGLVAIANNEADCVIISNYRYGNISKQCEKLHLTTVYTGVDMDYYFAVRDSDMQLYSILARLTDVIPDATIHTSLTYYSTEDAKTSFVELIKDNLFIIMTTVSIVLFIIVILLLLGIRAEKKVIEEKKLIKNLNRRVFVDALTSVRNKGAFSDHIKKLQERIDQGEEFEFAIGIFDCNNLKAINDQYGHDKGDIYLKTACQLICKIFDHSPVFRIGGDEFAVILQNSDYSDREKLVEQFEIHRKEMCDSAKNKWDEVHIAIGIAVYNQNDDSLVSDTIRRADRLMYENKRIGKTQF